MRKFIASIDVDSDDVTTQVYTCQKCEVDLDQFDIKQLEWNEEMSRGKKRLKGVVIDGKVVALLKDLGPASDNHQILQVAKGIRTRVVTNCVAQNAMRLFIKLVRSVLASTACREMGLERGSKGDDG